MTLPAPPSETPETCSHELWEMETACADGLCPFCLQRRLWEAEREIEAWIDWYARKAKQAEAAERLLRDVQEELKK